jgi:hypothetical protein
VKTLSRLIGLHLGALNNAWVHETTLSSHCREKALRLSERYMLKVPPTRIGSSRLSPRCTSAPARFDDCSHSMTERATFAQGRARLEATSMRDSRRGLAIVSRKVFRSAP